MNEATKLLLKQLQDATDTYADSLEEIFAALKNIKRLPEGLLDEVTNISGRVAWGGHETLYVWLGDGARDKYRNDLLDLCERYEVKNSVWCGQAQKVWNAEIDGVTYDITFSRPAVEGEKIGNCTVEKVQSTSTRLSLVCQSQ